jgi:hypothetical protein
MIPDYIRSNFQTFCQAVKNGDACIVEVIDKETKLPEFLMCIHQTTPPDNEGKTEQLTPMARIFKLTEGDDPYDKYDPGLETEEKHEIS